MKSILTGIALATLALISAPFAHASTLQFTPQVQSAVATTTLTFIASGGSATTTALDAFAQGQIRAIDQGVLLWQNTASSTSTVVGVTTQYSQDGIDWYSDDLSLPTLATTSQPFSINTPVSFTLKAAGTAVALHATLVRFPTRFIREVFSVTGAADAIWWQFIPLRQAVGGN